MDNGTHFGQGLAIISVVLIMVTPGAVAGSDEDNKVPPCMPQLEALGAAVRDGEPGDVVDAAANLATCAAGPADAICLWGTDWVDAQSSDALGMALRAVDNAGYATFSAVVNVKPEGSTVLAKEFGVTAGTGCATAGILGSGPSYLAWGGQFDAKQFLRWYLA